MKREEYVRYFIDNIKNTFPLLPYQEIQLEELLNKEYDRQMKLLKPKFTTHTQTLFVESRNPDNTENLKKKLLDGRSPIQIILDEMHKKPIL